MLVDYFSSLQRKEKKQTFVTFINTLVNNMSKFNLDRAT